MRNLKFKVESEKHSEDIQNELFRIGYKWGRGGQSIQETDKPFIIVSNGGTIYFAEDRFDELEDSETYTLEQLKKVEKNVIQPGDHSLETRTTGLLEAASRIDKSMFVVFDREDGNMSAAGNVRSLEMAFALISQGIELLKLQKDQEIKDLVKKLSDDISELGLLKYTITDRI